MNYPFEKVADGAEETKLIAEEFAEELNGGDLVLFHGNLGSGKTFFVRSVCSALGIDGVTSPTFSLVNEYHGEKKVFHIDLYRIEKADEFENIGLYDYLSDEDAVKFVEWAELFPEQLKDYDFLITIEYIDDNKRKIKIERK
ncbi:MAG: tRNA (adenosine(37)-N6)-threonylcarbamoyltransferase complex ATPase subunit type 1 TsaE [Chlorobi bacterium]|nr:tRNA (adenosine(37)-N6)-threonylcarbamoyltransferase complex ATPase subunit type 1 TsaE [Chlorobiota bacterium]